MADHPSASASASTDSTCSEALANAATIAQLQQRLDKATRELNSERQRCEAAVSNSAQLQQRLDSALSMSCSASALSSAFEALLPPSPPRLNIEPSQSPLAAAASPAPSLHAQLSQVSVSATEVRAMAAAAAAASAAALVTEAATLQHVHSRAAAASNSCSRIANGLCHVLQQLQGTQARLREQQLQLKEAQVGSPSHGAYELPCLITRSLFPPALHSWHEGRCRLLASPVPPPCRLHSHTSLCRL